MKLDKQKLPLVYSCSGCSSAAQMANYLALKMDRAQLAQMSCIAGVGGGVDALVKIAQSGRPIIAIDGCPLVCVKHCLNQQGLTADAYVILSDFGIKKRRHADFDRVEAEQLFPLLEKEIGRLQKAEHQQSQPS